MECAGTNKARGAMKTYKARGAMMLPIMTPPACPMNMAKGEHMVRYPAIRNKGRGVSFNRGRF